MNVYVKECPLPFSPSPVSVFVPPCCPFSAQVYHDSPSHLISLLFVPYVFVPDAGGLPSSTIVSTSATSCLIATFSSIVPVFVASAADVAVIVTVPFLLKNVTNPLSSTVAMLSSDVLHVTVLSVAFSGSTVAFNCNVLFALDTVVIPDLELTVTPVGATSVESRISNASSSIFVPELAACFSLRTFS